MLSTKDIQTKYNVTRQTLNNWIKQELISKPEKDWRGWLNWTDENETEIRMLLKAKAKKVNKNLTNKDLPLKISNRRYLGSKTRLLPFINEIVKDNCKDVRIVADVFAGTGVVADMFRKQGKKVIVNDLLLSNYVSYNTWFGSELVDYEKIQEFISQFNKLEGKVENYVSINFGDKYFSMENARKIGEIRREIKLLFESNKINYREKCFLLTSLIYALDKVANTVGHYDSYRRKMDSYTPIHLRIPEFIENVGHELYKEDANELIKKVTADLVYIDTPYNSRQYGDAYHLLENIVEWKKPEVRGVAKKMVDRQHIKSNYSTSKAVESFRELIKNINSKYILVSYNNMAKKGNGRSNAKISNEEIIEILQTKGTLQTFSKDFQVFTTGKTNIDDHKEVLYLCEVQS